MRFMYLLLSGWVRRRGVLGVVMNESDEAAMTLSRADRAERVVHEHGRRFALALAGFGVAWFVIVMLIPVTKGLWGVLLAVVLILFVRVGRRYNDRQPVRSIGADRVKLRVIGWTVVPYVVLVVVVAPLWLADAAWGWWALAGTLVALGTFVEAGLMWRAHRR